MTLTLKQDELVEERLVEAEVVKKNNLVLKMSCSRSGRKYHITILHTPRRMRRRQCKSVEDGKLIMRGSLLRVTPVTSVSIAE